MFRPCVTNFDLDRHLIFFLQEIPFFAELSRHIRKVPTKDIPTAGIAFNVKADELVLGWNPEFFETLTNWQIKNVLTHELYHIIFGHLSSRIKSPPQIWNLGTDLAINSIIVNSSIKPKGADVNEQPFPMGCLIPGVYPEIPDRLKTKEEMSAACVKVSKLIQDFSHNQASEYYFGEILKVLDDEELQALSLGSFDSHDNWSLIPEASRPYVESRTKALIEKAVKFADSHSNGWGMMPHDLVREIRASVSNIVNWKAVLRQFIGHLVRGRRRSTIKRVNKRYPYVHPGTKRGYSARLLLAIDQSGSVDDEMLEMFFAELRSLTQNVEIDILPFDWTAEERHIFTWPRGARPEVKRTKDGGTSFTAPSMLYNDPKNRGRWDALLIMTDGGGEQPPPVRGKRGWILGQGMSLPFKTSELQIFLDKDKPMSGAWR